MEDNVLVLQTGGTIDKDYPKRTGGFAFEIDEAASIRILKRAKITSNVAFQTICRKDSQEITSADRKDILQVCLSSKAGKILVTHGTDTLIETGKFLESNIHDKKIVLTGCFKPETFKDSDADFNIGFAFGALAILPDNGVFIAMNGIIQRPGNADRDKVTGNFCEIKTKLI